MSPLPQDSTNVTAASPPEPLPPRTLRELLESRWSCREFLRRQVSQSEIERVVDVARLTPSWCNTQPWHVDVLSGGAAEGLRDALRAAIADGPAQNPDIEFPAAYDGVYRERRRESGLQLYASVGIEKSDRAGSARQMLRNFDFFGAPHVAIVTTEAALGPYGAVDCGLFVSNFLLAAHELGIATVPQAALATQSPVIREYLGMKPERQVVVGISFGYPDEDAPVNAYRTSRQSIAEVASFHR
ncbi:nitroreductase [Gordonia westfalica]|uniref:Nitroreductase n=1 Tax=Gordonia westfalica TaxID=158898 RepID=A0A1H2KDX0_9ACTN|nr:nitroreductase [Gordonia westfalica]SDU66917.1 Nitroreductase [Gordonia westfalica]